MTKHIKNIIEGAVEAFSIKNTDGSYVRPSKGDWSIDANHLRGDVSKIGNDLRKTAKKELAVK